MRAAEVPRGLRAIARVIPSVDRESILGDLLEDAEWRNLRGVGRTVWLTATCAGIAGGLCLERMRSAAVLPPVREIASGMAIEGRFRWRGSMSAAALRGLAFCGAVATLALGVDVLVRVLLTAAGL